MWIFEYLSCQNIGEERTLLIGQQIVQPNGKGIGPEGLGSDVYYSISTLGEIHFSKSESDNDEWENYKEDFTEGYEQYDGGMYLR